MKILSNIVYLELSDFPESAHEYLFTAMKRARNGEANSYMNIPDPSDARKKLIYYDSVPKSALEKHKIGDKEAITTANRHKNITDQIKIDTTDLDFYLNIPKANPLATEYADIASWHKWCAKDALAYSRENGFASVDQLYEICIGLMNARNWRTWKIKNLRKFKDSIKPFKDALKGNFSKEDALQSLISAKFGTCNAGKLVIEPAAQALLVQLYSDPKKLSFTQTFMMYRLQAVQHVEAGKWSDKTIITEATIENYLKRPDVEQTWYLGRHGLQAWRRKFDHINKRIPATFANAKWVIDGTAIPLYYQEGKNAYARLNAFVVLDEHSWCVLGFMVSHSENSEQVIKSLQMACTLNKVLPHQIQFDNSAAIKSVRTQMVIEKIAKYGTPTQVGNARAKVIEPFFKQLFARILKFEDGYAFSPVMGKTLDSAQNRDALQVQIKAGLIPQGRASAIDHFIEVLNTWNKHTFNGLSSPLAKYRKSMEDTSELQRPFTHMMEVDAFWTMAGDFGKVEIIEDGKKKIATHFKAEEFTYNNWGLRLQIDNVKHDFDTMDAAWWSKSIGEKFNVKYDPTNIDRVYLYQNGKPVADENGKFVCLKNKEVYHSAIADHKEGEMAAIHSANNLRKEHKKQVIQRHKDTIELTKQDATYTPVTLGNMYPKELMNAVKSLTMEAETNNAPDEIEDAETVLVEPMKIDRFGF